MDNHPADPTGHAHKPEYITHPVKKRDETAHLEKPLKTKTNANGMTDGMERDTQHCPIPVTHPPYKGDGYRRVATEQSETITNMTIIECDLCGTEYPATSNRCPSCNWKNKGGR